MVVHLAVGLNGTTRGFEPDLAEFYGLVTTWQEDVTLAGADTILAQEAALAHAPPGPGPDPDGPLLAVVDSQCRVSSWDALRQAGHWRDAVPLRGHDGSKVDLREALETMAAEGARTVRVDSGGRLVGALLSDGLVDEVSLLVHPVLGEGATWNGGCGSGVRLEPAHVERRGHGLVWLRYDVVASRSGG